MNFFRFDTDAAKLIAIAIVVLGLCQIAESISKIWIPQNKEIKK